MKMSKFRPRFKQVKAKQWLSHGDHQEVRALTFWERMTAERSVHSSLDLGMLVLGDHRHLVRPGDWIIYDEDSVRVLSNDDFEAMYLPIALDPNLQELVEKLEDFKGRLGDKTDTIELIDSAITGLYLQAEVISKCYAEKYEYDTRFLPRKHK